MPKTDGLKNMMAEWEQLEIDMIEYTQRELKKEHHPLSRTILKILQHEAQKHGSVQQMIMESARIEAAHLSPDELNTLSTHLDRRLSKEEKLLSLMEKALNRTDNLIPRYLIAYLIADYKHQNRLLRQFDDVLKTASIPTSVTGKTFDYFK